MSKKSILQVGKFFPPYAGGMETVLKNLCDSTYTNYNLEVLVSNTSFNTVYDFYPYKVTRAASISKIYSLSICPTFPLLMNKMKSDIIHIHLPNPLAELSYLISSHKGKLIAHFHSDIIRQKKFMHYYKNFLYKFLDKCDTIIVPTPNHITSSEFISSYESKCVIIPFGIEITQYRLKNENEIKMVEIIRSNPKPILLFVGRLVYYKGIEFLIESMKSIDALLYIVGTGPIENQLKALVTNFRLNDKIIFLGETGQRKLVCYYNACDIFILPSTANSEMFGVVQLEAMACRKPVISTKLPTGVSWVNQDKVTGLLVEPKNSLALADAINQLLISPEKRKIMGEAGYERVKENFTLDKMKHSLENLYESVFKRIN